MPGLYEDVVDLGRADRHRLPGRKSRGIWNRAGTVLEAGVGRDASYTIHRSPPPIKRRATTDQSLLVVRSTLQTSFTS